MASNNLFHANTPNNSYIFVNPEISNININPDQDFDEADVWYNNNNNSNNNSRPIYPQLEAKKMVVPSFRSLKRGGEKVAERKTTVTCAASSLPVNIPDWSKIYRGSYGGGRFDRDRESDDHDDEGGDDDEESRVPPHEYLARRRGASFSVHEGIGRTLKGRDLRQVRNAIWKKVGFED